ncbi:WD40 domain-containing protein/Apc4_WD40 domain-containing protein/Apc4 domain-containing protein [Cephalotus follicularis]|uniref:Anaphase-promoting complex subunit 4 n=1 Tax=Cephalotus follicularis TaxID=3775 RepID=A0A1Q3ASZ3_CEPFO|nr:WD40 domain-containing protein/Apc4_WD40 domain-containing protein/Apc4 domain-containing protein [Cephalotus follicularis]
MDTDETQRQLPFQLQFDKPIASQVKIAEWNPEKDLLAMVTEDSKILLHRFNWQRLWTISPGRSVTSLCWRPDGKAIAVGLEDGTVSLHDVENGKLLRSLKSHTAAVVCLNWEEDRQLIRDDSGNISIYEDRTSRFFPPAPRVPRMAGVVSGDTGFMDDTEDSFRELSDSSHQRFNVLCSGDRDGSICFSIFGIFSIGKINIHNLSVPSPLLDKQSTYQLLNASIYKVALSKDLCRLIVMCSGELDEVEVESREGQMDGHDTHGLHSLVLDTSIFWKRKNELHQVAQQASNIEDLNEVIKTSLSIMCKQWSDAMHIFHEKFDGLSTLIADHGLESSSEEEFLSLLGGARTSPAVHQFLVNSLGESGLKRVSKVVCGAGKELQHIVLEHLQPAAEIIGFRMGELRGLSRWRARYRGIGLDEKLINDATERSGMFLVQVERFMWVLSSVMQQFSNFFNWLLKCIKLLMQEPSDQLLQYNSELVVIFLKFLYDQDPVRKLLELSEDNHDVEIDLETIQRVRELVQFGGFSDCNFLRRTLAKEFRHLESSFKEAFVMPFTTISQKILCEDLLPLFPLPSSPASTCTPIPMSVSYYEDGSKSVSSYQTCQNGLIDYVSFQIPDDPLSDIANCIGIARGFIHDSISIKRGYTSLEAVFLSIPIGYNCVDMSLYKESQIVLLLNETTNTSESSGEAFMMIVQASDLSFVRVSRSTNLNLWKLHLLKDSVVYLQMENEKVRRIPHSVTAPLAVGASRGVACVFASRKRALVYILEEDEDEVSDTE